MLRNLDIVVTVDAEYVLHEVGFTLHVHTIGRNGHAQHAVLFVFDHDFEGCEYLTDGLFGYLLADEGVHTRKRQVEAEIFGRLGTYVGYFARYLAAGKLLHKQGGTLQCVYLHVRVDAAFETERRIGIQSEAFCRLAHPHGIEIGTFEEDVARGVADTRIEASENAGYAHRAFGRAYHQVL